MTDQQTSIISQFLNEEIIPHTIIQKTVYVSHWDAHHIMLAPTLFDDGQLVLVRMDTSNGKTEVIHRAELSDPDAFATLAKAIRTARSAPFEESVFKRSNNFITRQY